MFTSDQDCWEGALHSTKNARALLDNALAIYSSENLGCSAALMILSAEESSKALAIGFHIVRPVSEEYLKPFFKVHKDKHKHATYVSNLIQQLITDMKASGDQRFKNLDLVSLTKKWAASAESVKQRGFYVDYKNSSWATPNLVTLAEYENAKIQAGFILSLAESFFIKGTLNEFLESKNESP